MKTLTREERFIRLAAKSIMHGLKTRRTMGMGDLEFDSELSGLGACFVTLQHNGQLRGCIGSTEARRPLGEDLVINAYNTAFNDIRFPRLNASELEGLEIELSILTSPKPLVAKNEEHLIEQLRPGVDGVIIEDQGAKAIFLPTVWSSLPDPVDFIANLKRKARLGSRPLSSKFIAWRFETEKIKSSEALGGMPLWDFDSL